MVNKAGKIPPLPQELLRSKFWRNFSTSHSNCLLSSFPSFTFLCSEDRCMWDWENQRWSWEKIEGDFSSSLFSFFEGQSREGWRFSFCFFLGLVFSLRERAERCVFWAKSGVWVLGSPKWFSPSHEKKCAWRFWVQKWINSAFGERAIIRRRFLISWFSLFFVLFFFLKQTCKKWEKYTLKCKKINKSSNRKNSLKY